MTHLRAVCKQGGGHGAGQPPTERFVLTVRMGLSDRMLIFGERHLRLILTEQEAHCSGRRPHRSRAFRPPRPDQPVARLSPAQGRPPPAPWGRLARSARPAPAAPPAAGVGLARTCLGLVRALDRRGVHVAFVKPVAQPRADGSPDRSNALVAAITALRPPDPLSTVQLEEQLGEGGLDVVLEKIVAAWEPVYDRSDVVVVEGLSLRPARLYATEFNQALAGALDADVLLAACWPTAGPGSAGDRAGRAAEPMLDPAAGTVGGLAEMLAITARGYWSGENARVVGCVVHGLPPDDPAPAAPLAAALDRRGLRRSEE